MLDLSLPTGSDEPLTGGELGELARLDADEDERYLVPLRHGPIEGIAVLRRRLHGNMQPGALEAVEVRACAVIVALSDGAAGWKAHGLEELDDRQLEAFWRRTQEVGRAVTREQLRREAPHA
jgi:hypothetical protein